VAISKSFFGIKAPLPRTVYVASGELFPDALSIASVAGSDCAPLLLTKKGSLPQAVADEIKRLKPTRIVVAGGAIAVSDVAFEQLKALVSDTVRVGGGDRYETSRLVAEYGMNAAKVFPAGTTSNAFIATGTDYPDALSAGAVAGLKGICAPVILVPGLAAAMPTQIGPLLDKLGTKKLVAVGGTGVIGNTLFASIPAKYAPVRVAGADRYQTSQEIVKTFRVPLQVSGALTSQGVFATGKNFPDALAGAAYAAASGSTLWVIPPTCVPNAVLTTANTLKLDHYALLGGTRALAAPVDSLTACK
jgi:putative cell wall-binding protein